LVAILLFHANPASTFWIFKSPKQVAQLKILIEIRREHYDPLLTWVAKDSPLYSAMINAVIVRYSGQGGPVMMMVCEDDEARALLDIAKQFYPDVAAEIEQAIQLKRAP
jgi:hypothetical protein